MKEMLISVYRGFDAFDPSLTYARLDYSKLKNMGLDDITISESLYPSVVGRAADNDEQNVTNKRRLASRMTMLDYVDEDDEKRFVWDGIRTRAYE